METHAKSKQNNLRKFTMGVLYAVITLSVIAVPFHAFAQTNSSNVSKSNDVQQYGNQSGPGEKQINDGKECRAEGDDREINNEEGCHVVF